MSQTIIFRFSPTVDAIPVDAALPADAASMDIRIRLAPRTVLRYYPSEESTDHSTIVVLKDGRFYDTETKVHYNAFEDWRRTLPDGVIYVNQRNAVDQVRAEKAERLAYTLKLMRDYEAVSSRETFANFKQRRGAISTPSRNTSSNTSSNAYWTYGFK